MHTTVYEKITDALVDEGYIVIKNVFEERVWRELLQYAKGEASFKKAGISSGDELHLDSTRRRDKISWLEEDSGVQSKFLNFTNGLQVHLNRELFLGLKYYESHFAVYEKGAFYEKHLDCFKSFKNRVVTTVYYLNENWSQDDGGELIVYDLDDNIVAKVAPQANTLIVFMSEKFPHEVLPSKTQRYSIAGWFRIDKHV